MNKVMYHKDKRYFSVEDHNGLPLCSLELCLCNLGIGRYKIKRFRPSGERERVCCLLVR